VDDCIICGSPEYLAYAAVRSSAVDKYWSQGTDALAHAKFGLPSMGRGIGGTAAATRGASGSI
jgi:hypothetical protein